MWIEPLPRAPNSSNTGAHWTVLEQNDFFALQSQLDSSVYAAERDNKLALAKPFRIILKPEVFPAVFEGGKSNQSPGNTHHDETKFVYPIVTIALADEEKDIREHWNFLVLNVLPQMIQFDRVKEQKDLYGFVTKKISAMATEEDLANLEAPSRRVRGGTIAPQILDEEKRRLGEEQDKKAGKFKGLKKLITSVGDRNWHREKSLLVAEYDCSLLVEIKRPGRMWITANNVYFLSEDQKTHVLLRIYDILEISIKNLTQGSSDSIELATSKSKFFFTEFQLSDPLGVELVYNVLDRLWSAALYRIHSLSVATLAEKENEEAEEEETDEEEDFEDMIFRSDAEEEGETEGSRKPAGNEGVPPPGMEDGASGLVESGDATPKPPLNRSDSEEANLVSAVAKVVPSRPIDVLRPGLGRDLEGRDSPALSSRSGSPLSLSLERLSDVDNLLKQNRSDDSGKDSEDEESFLSAPKGSRRGRSRTSTLSASFSALSSSCSLSYFASTEVNRKSADDSPLHLPEPLVVDALIDQRKKEIFHRLFRLPLDEVIHDAIWCTFTIGSESFTGHLFISTNYLCFHSVPIPLFGGVVTESNSEANYDDYGGIPVGNVTEKKKSKVTMILSLGDIKIATLRVGNAKKEQLISREEDELRKREDMIHSPRRKSMPADPSALKYKSPLGRPNPSSMLYRSMITLPQLHDLQGHGHGQSHSGASGNTLEVGPKSVRSSPEKGGHGVKDESAGHHAAGDTAHSEEGTDGQDVGAGGEDSTQTTTPEGDATAATPSTSKTEKNVRKMLERMLSDTELVANSNSDDQQELEDIIKLGEAAEAEQELGAKSIRVLEKLLDRKNKEIRGLVKEREMYKERAQRLETHLRQLVGDLAFTCFMETLIPQPTPPTEITSTTITTTTTTTTTATTSSDTDAAPAEATPHNTGAETPKFTLNSVPMTASGNVALPPRPEDLVKKEIGAASEALAAKSPRLDALAVSKMELEGLVLRVGETENQHVEEPVKNAEGDHIVKKEAELQLQGDEKEDGEKGNTGSPTKGGDASAAHEIDRREPMEPLHLSDEHSKEECILFRMRNDMKYIFSFEKKAFATTKCKDGTGVQDLIHELCSVLKPQASDYEKPSVPGIPQHLYKTTSQFSADYLEKQPYRLIIWERYFAAHGADKNLVRHSDEIAGLLFCYDLPDSRRGELWAIFSCAAFYVQRGKGEYANILRSYRNFESEYAEAIAQDLDRSFPGHPYFASEEGMNKIKNVLLAYSWRNPHIGYTQGMNIIVALLLCFMDEESAFWTLCCICEVMFPEYYNNGFLGLIIDQRVFVELAQEYVPEVCAIFNKRGIPLALIVAPWFMTLYVSHLTLESSLHVLSQMLFGGPDSPMLFLVGLAVLKIKQQFVTDHDDVNPVDMCHDIPCDELCKAVQEIEGVTVQRVKRLRRKHRYFVVQEMMQQSAIDLASIEYSKPIPRRVTSLSGLPTPISTPTATPSSTPHITPYSTPLPTSHPQSPEQQLRKVVNFPEHGEGGGGGSARERRDTRQETDKPQREIAMSPTTSPPVASPIGSPPLPASGDEKDKERDEKELVRKMEREREKEKEKESERAREKEKERRARRERERERERERQRERERSDTSHRPLSASSGSGRRPTVPGVSLAGLKIGQSGATSGPRSQPATKGLKSPRRKHRRYVSGVFDQQPNSEQFATKKKEDKTWKQEINNLGILDVIYSIFSEPKRKEGEPRLF